MNTPANQSAPASRRPAGQSVGSDNLAAIVAAVRAFPAAVAELGRRRHITPLMNNKIDIKSALIGLLLGVLVTVAIAAATSPSQAGRYQVAGTGSYGLVLDTATGQVWTMFFSSSGGRTDGDAFYQPKVGQTK